MKFAKELERDLVPEWRIKYLDYKAGKKHVKNVARAVTRANGTPRMPGLARHGSIRDTFFSRPDASTPQNRIIDENGGTEPAGPLCDSPTTFRPDSGPEPEAEDSSGDQKVTTPMLIPNRQRAKRDSSGAIQYGSFVPTPPSSFKPAQLLELPGPALGADLPTQSPQYTSTTAGPHSRLSAEPLHPLQPRSSPSTTKNTYEVGRTNPSSRTSTLPSYPNRMPQPLPHLTSNLDGPRGASPRAFMQRLLSRGRQSGTNAWGSDVGLPALDQVRSRQKDFSQWMDKELDKIESFYKSKEDEAGERLMTLRQQLHEMRNRRIDEIAEAKRAKEIRKHDEHALDPIGIKRHSLESNGNSLPGARDHLHAWIQPIEKVFENAKTRTRRPRPGSNSKALQNMDPSPEIASGDLGYHHQQTDPGRDYVRRPRHDHEVPYRSAKGKLKLALKEYYRGLELLKSYALLNRTAFRKINKKYDKAINARPPLRYMAEKVNKAWFVQSDVIDGYLQAVEDLYSRYFERGNHKIAIGKLRSSGGRPGQYTGNAFRSGLLVGTGAVFAVHGLVYACNLLLYHPDANIRTQTSYLLQIYAGYFLALYLFMWFCLDCCIWARNKINYVFIFEFDPRNHLDWRELFEFQSYFLLILSLCIWLNFSSFGATQMFIYWPVILISASVLVIFLPAPIVFHRSRRWFVYSHWRLLLAGLYPVEFRDFLLGDMYCSLTYFMSNIELFFCIYAQYWSDPPQCNSVHSRLLGFFSTLPGIWRALQCIRRYHDTRSFFPHLLNCGKYSMTIMSYVSLSLYRIQGGTSLLALFVTFATINAIYCSIWDLAMDWSLCQPDAEKRFLRDVRGYKYTWPYYTAMVVDPILRFNWIFYIMYAHDLQHSSIASFLIAFSEVSRRGMWTLFRVENEHCANVSHFKASRDVPLPYPLSPEADTFVRPQTGSESPEPEGTTTQSSPALSRRHGMTTVAEEGEAVDGLSSTLRRRAPSRTLTKIFAEAHMQDFEKKRKPGAGDSSNVRKGISSDEDDEDEQDAACVR